MEFLVFASYIFFAFILFLFLNFLTKRFSLTKTEYILFSNVFLIFIASVASYFKFGAFCDNLFIIIVFEFLIRMLYTTYILENDFFAKEDGNLVVYLGNLVVSYLINQFIISRVDMVFLNPEQLKFLLWIFIILFFYHFFYKKNEFSVLKDKVEKHNDLGSKKNYIISQYTKMRQKYGKYIQLKNDLRLFIYALMIYENYKKPSLFRQLDYFRYQFDHIPKKQGIMQVDSKKIMSDVESITYVEKKVEKAMEKKTTKKKNFDVSSILKLLGKKKEESVEIEKIYEVLKDFETL